MHVCAGILAYECMSKSWQWMLNIFYLHHFILFRLYVLEYVRACMRVCVCIYLCTSRRNPVEEVRCLLSLATLLTWDRVSHWATTSHLDWLTSDSPRTCLFLATSPCAEITSIYNHIWLFIWVFRIWTQVQIICYHYACTSSYWAISLAICLLFLKQSLSLYLELTCLARLTGQ